MATGFKTGGRQKGTKNKRKSAPTIMAEARGEAAQAGESPLAYMLRLMNDPLKDDKRRDEMAKAAAPYMHAKLSAAQVDLSPEPDNRSAEELRAELVAELAELGIALIPIGEARGAQRRLTSGPPSSCGVRRICREAAMHDVKPLTS